MAAPYRVLRVARWVFLVLAYLLAGINLTVGGLWPLIVGGEPVQLLVDGPELPARVYGLLNIVVSAPLAFLFFYLPSGIIRVLLEVRERLSSR